MFEGRTAPVRRTLRAAGALACALACLVATGTGVAATSSTVVGATVPSATALSTAGCASNTPDVTNFGSVTAGSSVVTNLECVVTFGSSNDTARLRMAQTDAAGDAMFQELGAGGATDPGFGGGTGMLVDAAVTANNASTADSSGGIARQSNGSFLVTGENGGTIVVRRYSANGTLDGTFGPVSVAPCAASQDVAGIDVAADDSFVIGGDAGATCPTVRAWAMRFSANGTQDMAYGGDGIADTAIGMEVRDLSLFPDGGLALGGGSGAHEVIRLLPNGSLDNGFDGNGHLAAIPVVGGGGSVRGVEAMPDGTMIVSGYSNVGSGDEAYVARLQANGTLLPTWAGGDGWERTSATPNMEGRSLTIAPDGSIYVAAYQGIVKFTSAGLLDSSFGAGGVADLVSSEPLASLNDVEAQYDGKVVGIGIYNSNLVLAARFTASGALDPTFGTNGVQTQDPAGTGNGANRAVWTGDGDLLTFGPGGSGASIVRFDGRSISDYDNVAANWTTPGTNAFGACLETVAGGASALWTSDGTCNVANTTEWNEVTPTPSPVARTTVSGTQGATARLNFGLRTLSTQAAGTYIAPITFSVVAPDA